VNGALLEAFRHNAWATKQLLEFCRDLSVEQLTAPGIGTYAGILETFNHIVLSDARYLRRLAGSARITRNRYHPPRKPALPPFRSADQATRAKTAEMRSMVPVRGRLYHSGRLLATRIPRRRPSES
jgi:uncharacterized damage-inducible protein DinB